MKFEIENWEKINVNTAKFTFEQAEKYLNSTIKTAEIHHRRATVALQAIISLIILLVAFLSSGYNDNTLLIHIAFIGLGILVILLFDAFKVYNQYKNHPVGNLPSNILNNEIIDFANEENL